MGIPASFDLAHLVPVGSLMRRPLVFPGLLLPLSLAACQGAVTIPGGGTPDCGDFAACSPAPSPSFPDWAQAVAADAAGNVYVVGAADVDSVFVFSLTKLGPDGAQLWRRTYGDGAYSNAYRMSAAADAQGNLVVAGEFGGSGDFGGSTLASVGSNDAFAVLLDGAGDVRWARSFGTAAQVWTTGGDDVGGSYVGASTGASDVTFDAAGNVVLVGEMERPVDFGAGPLDPAAGDDFVVTLAGPSGASLWSRGVADCWVPHVAVDGAGAVVVAATYRHDGSFMDGVILHKLDGGGSTLWTRTFPGGSGAGPSAVRADAAGNIVIAGSFEGALDFGTGPLAGGGSFDAYVASFDPAGATRWAGVFGGPDFVANSRLVVDAAGETLLAADCRGTASYQGVSVTAAAGQDICLLRLDASGQPLSTGLYSGTFNQRLEDMAVTPAGTVVVVGLSVDDEGSGAMAGFVGTVPP